MRKEYNIKTPLKMGPQKLQEHLYAWEKRYVFNLDLNSDSD